VIPIRLCSEFSRSPTCSQSCTYYWNSDSPSTFIN